MSSLEMLAVFISLIAFQIVHASCPDGYELIRDGQCRGFLTEVTPFNAKEPEATLAKCNDIQGQPVIIHDEEQQSYWVGVADKIMPPRYLLLGLRCNATTYRAEWVDGSAVDYRPPGYTQGLDGCYPPLTFMMKPGGYWGAADNNMNYVQSAEVYCTTQLQQPPGDGCESFEDDGDDGVCYQVQLSVRLLKAGTLLKRHVAISEPILPRFIMRKKTLSCVVWPSVNGVFLGGTISGKGKEFGWIDGSDWDYNNFNPNFPIDGLGDCLIMDTLSTAGQWMNMDCVTPLPMACSRPRDTVPTCSTGPWKEGQVIYSPGYPYDASVPCDWFITVEKGHKVAIQVKFLEANSCCDHLILIDNYAAGKTIANLTGELTDTTYISDTNFMRVSWQPNGGVNVRGMAFTFAEVNTTPAPK